MSQHNLLTREEVLAGLPSRRASALLFLLENRTSHMMAQSRQAAARYPSADVQRDNDLDYLEAFVLNRQPPLKPTIYELERYAPQWASLVPESPEMRATLAHLLARKYSFTRQTVPTIRAVLALDDAAVQQQYERLYGQPLNTLYAHQVGLAERMHQAWGRLANWLENLPPFWSAFAMTLTETVGAGTLALPIALAGIGPLPGLAILVMLGLLNVLTIAAMAEAVVRNGSVRYAHAYLGQVVGEYLGSMGSLILSLGMFALLFLALSAYYVGIATSLAGVIGLPSWLWVVAVFAVGLYFVSRGSMNATIASALVVGAVNIGLILALTLLAFTRLEAANLVYLNVPLIGGRPFDPSILQLVFGTILSAYFGHTTVAAAAPSVLRRDASGRSLIWGSVAAQLTAIGLYCLWVVGVNGAVAPKVMAAQTGTALAPLASAFGPGVGVLGAVYVLLAMGMASIHFSIGLFSLIKERLPRQVRPVMLLPRRRGRLILQPRGGRYADLRLTLRYLGLPDAPSPFEVAVQWGDVSHREKIAITGSWVASEWMGRLQGLAGAAHATRVNITVLGATAESARLQLDTTLGVTYEGDWDTSGLGLADALALPPDLRPVVRWILSQESVSVAMLAAHIHEDRDTAATLLRALAEKEYLREEHAGGEFTYVPHFAARSGSKLPAAIWSKVEQATGLPPATGEGSIQRMWGLPNRLRFLIAVIPILLVFLMTEWKLLAGSASFTGPISLIGVITVPLLAGIFPILLLATSRRKGEFVPQGIIKGLGHPLAMIGMYLLFLASLLLHGLVIWQDLLGRVAALAAAAIVLAVTVVAARRGSFTSRAVVGLWHDQSGGRETPLTYSVVSAGEPLSADVRLTYADSEPVSQRAAVGEVPHADRLQQISFAFSSQPVRELKVWAYATNPQGDTESMPVQVVVQSGKKKQEADLSLTSGQALLPIGHDPCQVTIAYSDRDEE